MVVMDWNSWTGTLSRDESLVRINIKAMADFVALPDVSGANTMGLLQV
jgi:hypothetical protein